MKSILDSVKLGKLSLANRIVRSATYEGMAKDTGEITPQLLKIYSDLAANKIGLIITSGAYIMSEGKGMPGMLGIHDDSLINGYRQLTDQVHLCGGKIIMQLIFCGTQGFIDVPNVYSPSAVPEKLTRRTGKAMRMEDIGLLREAFVDAAARAKKAGFDGIEIHSSAGFLLSQFLTPYYNRRNDAYGGGVENRARLLFEICDAIREKVGEEFVVLVKINCADFIEEGFSFEDSVYVCSQLVSKNVDAIEITGGIAAVREITSVRKDILSPGQESYFAEHAAKIAAEVSVPVILDGGNRSLEVMNQLVNQTNISFFAMCRPFIAEPGLVSRWYEGDTRKARCISCNKCSSFCGTYCKNFVTTQENGWK